MHALEAARWWIEHGFWPIPIGPKQKGPTDPGWQDYRLDANAPLENYFSATAPQNLGVLLGDKPGNLADVDLDTVEARWAWSEVGIDTDMVFGRKSNPASHHFFRVEPQPAHTMKYIDPLAKDEKACLIELRSLAAGGKIGLQTVVPPSVHPSGETIEFVRAGMPSLVTKEVLEAAVRYTGAAVLLGRHAQEGRYHDFFLALAGALARCGWHLEKTAALLRAIYRVLWEDAADIGAVDKEVNSTYDRYAAGGETTGLRTLQDMLDLKVFRKLTQWLGLREEEAPRPPKPTPPAAEPVHILKYKDIVMPTPLIEDLVTTPGLYLVAAPGKAGKTSLAVQMAMSLANGLALFDNYKTSQTASLILEWDDQQGEASLKTFTQSARAAREPMPFHYILPGEAPLSLSDPEFIPFLRSEIMRLQAGFVILDSYTALRGVRANGHGDIVKLESAELMLLSKLARGLGCVILLIHHDSKSSAHLDWGDRAAGSYAVGAAPDGLIRVARFPQLAEGDGARLVSVRGRHLRGTEMVVKYSPTHHDFDLVLDGSASRDYPDLKQLYAQFPSLGFTAKDVAKELGWTVPSTYRLLNRLLWGGVLRKDSSAWNWDPGFNTKYLML